MREISPGIRHWSAEHPKLQTDVSSYWLPDLGLLLDPIAVPAEVDDVETILLSNRNHLRDGLPARERFGAMILAPRVGMHEFDEDAPVEPYDFEQPLLGGAVTAHQLTELWPDDCALHIPSVNALALADAVIHYGSELEFVPDDLMDNPEAEQRGLREGLTRMVEELEFEHLLLAHGNPVIGDGRERLRAFASG